MSNSISLLRPRLVAAALAATAAAAVAVTLTGGSATAQAPATRTVTFKTTEKGATFAHVRNSKGGSKSNNLGDLIVFTNPIVDASGARIGKESATCTTTEGNKDFVKAKLSCVVFDALAGGTLVSAGQLDMTKETVAFAVTGGTGEYAGARGTGVGSTEDGTTTMTLLP